MKKFILGILIGVTGISILTAYRKYKEEAKERWERFYNKLP